MRSTGIQIIGDVPWGTHFCQFYQNKQDLTDLLVPYFKAGLENDEFCMWVTSEPLQVNEAHAALAREVPDLDCRVRNGQIEILDYCDWYKIGGKFDAARVLQAWVEKLEAARKRGLEGLRLTGNTFWLEESDWSGFTEYEAMVDGVISQYPMLAMCTYCLARCGAAEIMDVLSNHAFALIKRQGQWQLIEKADRKRLEASLRESGERYRELFDSMEEGFAQCEMIYDESGRSLDFRYVNVNPAFTRLTGLPAGDVTGRTAREVIPGIENVWIEAFGRVMRTGVSERVDYPVEQLGRHYEAYAWRSSPGRFATVFTDVTERKKAERFLLESNQWLKRAQEIAHLGSWELDLRNNRLAWSDEVYRIFGSKPQEFPATYEAFLAYVHPEDRAAVDEAYKRSVRDGENTYEIEHRIVRPSTGEVRFVHEKCEHLRDEAGRTIRSVGMVHDVTESRRAEQALRVSEERYRSLFENMTEGFALHEIIVDETGHPCDYRFIDVNPSFERLTGLKRGNVVGKRVREVLPEIDPQWIETYGKVAATGQPANFENYYPDPLNRWYAVFAYRPSPGNFAVIFMDITARKRAEEDRLRLLESERAARSEAERVNRIKDEFLANLSHELRTPLNPILGWLQILRRRQFGDEMLAQGLQVIERNARIQTQLISDLLDMSRIISGKLRLQVQNCDLGSVIEGAIESILPGAEAKSIRVESLVDSSTGLILGDPSRLQQVFWNILANSVKFTPSQGKIRIVSRVIDSRIEVTISDTGQGIRREFLPFVFDRFRQGDSSAARKHGGLGLGLSIVKHIVELHGGTVAAESAGEGQGTTFTVSLPIMAVRGKASDQNQAAETGADGTTLGSVDLSGIKVLIVDDEADTRDVVARLLTERGAATLCAGSAKEALDLLQKDRPDVLVADIGMPEADGYALIRRIRELSPGTGGETPAVALTAYSRAEDRTQALLAGYQYHLAKPVETAELIATLAMMTRRIRRAQSAH